MNSIYIEQCKEHFDLIKSVYNDIKADHSNWPETHLYKGDWSAVSIKYKYSFLRKTPINFLLEDASVAFFSILRPGTILKPHYGYPPYCNDIYRHHFCIESSEDNYLFVEDQIYEWKVGEGFCFDDSKLHYGWNKGTTDRVVLLFDIPRDLHRPPPMSDKMVERYG